MHKPLVGLGFVLAIGACTSPSEPAARDVTLTPTATGYSSGALISATLANGSDVGYTYGDCHPRLERLEWRRWSAAGEDPGVCVGVLRTVPPQSTSQVSFQLDLGVPPGAYRLRLDVHRSTDDQRRVVRSREFTVVQMASSIGRPGTPGP